MNENIKIIQTNSMTEDGVIYDIMKIEEAVYEEQYRGKYEAIRERFYAFKDIFFIAYHEGEVVGNLIFYPINEKIYKDVSVNGNYHEDDLRSIDVVKIEDAKYLMLSSIAVLINMKIQSMIYLIIILTK